MTTNGPATWDGRPPGVPDGWSGLVPVGPGDVDGDSDGVPDTVVVARARGGAWIFTDVDGDGFADAVLDVAAPDVTSPDVAGPDVADPDVADGDPEADGPGVLDALVRLVTG